MRDPTPGYCLAARWGCAVFPEEWPLWLRYFYIDSIKRVQKDEQLSEAALRGIAEKLTNRKDRIEELFRRVREPNVRPWP